MHEKASSLKISVIIPIYNVEAYLEECLNSVISQTLKEIEIICVDDGSPDNSLAILNQYAKKDNRIIIISQTNQGLSGARNSGLELAQGEFVYFLDSDDYLDNNEALKVMYRAVENASIDILSFNHRTIGMEEKSYFREMKDNEVVNGKSYLQRNGMWSVMVWLRLYRREYLKKIDFRFVTGITSEDDEALPRFYFGAQRVKHIEDVLLVYRRRDDSISTSMTSPKLILGLVAIVRTYFHLSRREEAEGFNKYLYNKMLEYLFILFEKTFSVENQEEALLQYKILISKLQFTPLEMKLLENEEKYIKYHNVEKQDKRFVLSVYYTRRFRILYFKYIRRYGA